MKRLRVILLFLLMGAVVNVGVAWVIVLLPTPVDYSDNMVYGLFFDADERWTLNRYEAFGSHFYESRRWTDNSGEEELLRVKELLGGDKIENVKPNWGSMDRTTEFYQALSGPLDHQVAWERRLFHGRGWPMLSLWCMRFLEVDDGTGIKQFQPKGLIEISILPYGTVRRVLPLYPIWPGFIVNMLFYTVLSGLLFTATLALRRFIRNKRGLCLKCAYDLRGGEHEACPECGERVAHPSPN